MTYKDCLEIIASWASILTAVVAVVAYGNFKFERYGKRRRPEKYLQSQKAQGKDKGQRTIPHLVANLGMSESDVLDSAFRSNNVGRGVDVKDGKAIGLFFEYNP